jgi:hypothetical protein
MITAKTSVRYLIALVCIAATGCSVPDLLEFRTQRPIGNADLTFQIEPSNAPGEFEISGTADLPEGTDLTVLAVRRLYLKNPPLTAADPEPTYSILAYDRVTVESNRWQTQLSLWQVAADGAFKETWQIQDADLQLAVDPEETVLFLATLAPLNDLEEIEQILAEENRQFSNRFVQTTLEGSRYLQTGQVLPIDLPSGKTAPVAIRPEDLNGGWGNRFLPLPDLPNQREMEFPENRRTDAPRTEEEFLY